MFNIKSFVIALKSTVEYYSLLNFPITLPLYILFIEHSIGYPGCPFGPGQPLSPPSLSRVPSGPGQGPNERHLSQPPVWLKADLMLSLGGGRSRVGAGPAAAVVCVPCVVALPCHCLRSCPACCRCCLAALSCHSGKH